jgi:hypothetical protein
VNSSTIATVPTTTIHRGGIPGVAWGPWRRPTGMYAPVKRVCVSLIHSKITRVMVETSLLNEGCDQMNHRQEASAVGDVGDDLFGFAGVVRRPCSLFAPINRRWPVDEDHRQAI